MTDQYLFQTINTQDNVTLLALDSFDFRQVQGLVPTGTTASYQAMKIPGPARLARLAWSSVVPPGAGETVTLRLFRVRPASNPAGFGFVLLNSPFTISTSTFTNPGGDIDISSTILPDRCVLSGEYLACSWVHSGTQTMQPLDMNWIFTPVRGGNEAEPPATTTSYTDVFG